VRGQFLLGMCAAALHQNDKAVGAFQRVLELDPDQPAAYVALLAALAELGRIDEAEALRQKFRRRFGEELAAPAAPEG
jgi:pentatricopeptide repeat protein